MIVGTGVDLVEVERVGQLLDRYGDHFRGRIFTQDEVRYCERFRYKAERYAARFAAKEAAFKASGNRLARRRPVGGCRGSPPARQPSWVAAFWTSLGGGRRASRGPYCSIAFPCSSLRRGTGYL